MGLAGREFPKGQGAIMAVALWRAAVGAAMRAASIPPQCTTPAMAAGREALGLLASTPLRSPLCRSLLHPPHAVGALSYTSLTKEQKQARLRRAKSRRGRRVTPPAPRPGATAGDVAQADPPRALQASGGRQDSSLASGGLGLAGAEALIVTREIEMFNVFLGFEQKNRYTLRDRTGAVAGYVEEEGEGFGKVVSRQLLRTRRPLQANVYDAAGVLAYRIRRPFYLISSTIEIEDASGEVLGEVKQRWHLFRRNYDLYLNRNQFGEIKGNFLAWEFEITDEEGGTLALIDRNFAGFGIELFTDAGKYVIHFGGPRKAELGAGDAVGVPQLGSPWSNTSTDVTSMAKQRTNVEVQDPHQQGSPIRVSRPLSLAERAITIAAVVSIDFDYFSRHSGSHGVGGAPMPWFFPFPGIFGGGAEDDAEAGGQEGEGGAAGDNSGSGGGVGGGGDNGEGSWLDGWGDDDGDDGGGGWFDDIDFD